MFRKLYASLKILNGNKYQSFFPPIATSRRAASLMANAQTTRINLKAYLYHSIHTSAGDIVCHQNLGQSIEDKYRYDNVSRYYQYRPGYDPTFFNFVLSKAIPKIKISQLIVADIGSGNGVSRKALVEARCNPEKVYEIEPNGFMRELSEKNGGLHIQDGTASNTSLPSGQSDIIIFCNSIHQATTNKSVIHDIQLELNRIASSNARIIFIAQRFNPQDITIKALHESCEQWKRDGLYPAYGDNGIKFILNNSSDIENTKSILNEYPDIFMEQGYQESSSTHHIQYNEEEFLGLMRSYLSFPVNAPDELILNIRDFFKKHSDKENNTITVSCVQVAIIGKPLTTSCKENHQIRT